MSRPAIPNEIKREVRKKCFFGCIICGMPFFEYDHIRPYSEVRSHDSDNLVLLCPIHHAQKTTGKLTEDVVLDRKLSPANAGFGFSKCGLRVEKSKNLEVFLGSNQSISPIISGTGIHHTLWVNGVDFFCVHAQDDYFTFSIILTDKSGNILLHVREGEVLVSTSVWDFEYIKDRIVVRAALGNIILDVRVNSNTVWIELGIFLDKFKDGFIVDGPFLYEIINGTVLGTKMGHRMSCSNGSWAILNKRNTTSELRGEFGSTRFIRRV